MPKRAQKRQLDLPKNLRANLEYYRQLKDYSKEELADIMGFGLTTYYARLKDLDYTLPQLAKAPDLSSEGILRFAVQHDFRSFLSENISAAVGMP